VTLAERCAIAPVRGWAGSSLSTLATTFLVGGLVVGAAIGGVVGLVIGVSVHLATSPVALVEGGVFGAILALPVSAVLLAATLIVRWARR
jgi:cytochrome bd-type quinol oxidase subunit 1